MDFKNKEVINLKDLALLTGLSKSTLYKKTHNREIPHFKLKRTLFFNLSEIYQWLQANRVKTTEEIQNDLLTFKNLTND